MSEDLISFGIKDHTWSL